MLRYHVRARDLIDIYNELKQRKLILSPYFQRNLVWREVHKKDFIDTILKGLPFPQVFIAQGDINVETLESISVVVDGQQRINAIRDFVNNDLEVNGARFRDMDVKAQELFLKYQVPVIDLDIKANDPQIIDIFKRLNRTFYALSAIEKMATEYATTDLMLIAKYASGNLFKANNNPEEDAGEEADLGEAELHPLMPEDFIPWATSFEVGRFQSWLLKSKIFTEFEIARQVHLMFTLNIIATVYFGFFPRNEKTREFLDEAQESFPSRDEILAGLEKSAETIEKLSLPDDSIWKSKSNAFTLFIIFFWHNQAIERLGLENIKQNLLSFGDNLPADYALAAREAVNNRRQRLLRHEKVCDALGLPKEERSLRR